MTINRPASGSSQVSSQRQARPIDMLQRPKNRSCPSLRCKICSKVRRQPPGEMNGSRPSTTNTRARACQRVSTSKLVYFLGAAAAAPEPRMALKKSEEGSSTMTSDFLLKLAL